VNGDLLKLAELFLIASRKVAALNRFAKEKYTKEEKKRVDLDSRPPILFTEYKNYDYTDEEPDETSLGGGLYHGSMGKFKSIREFIEKRRKKLKERKEKFATLTYSITKMAANKKILVLDDDEDRHKGFVKALRNEQVTHVHDYQEAIDALDKETFEEIYLDHDLSDFGESTTGYGEAERTGADVALYIARMLPKDKRPKIVHIHSWNPVGAHNIAVTLESAGIPYVREPYGDPYSEDDVVMWYQDPTTGRWELKGELSSGDAELVERYEQAGYKVKTLPFGEDPNEEKS
jgi:CheY-like chemotaxis protein